MVIKKLIALALSALLTLVLAGCDGLAFNVDELLVSPKLEGDMHPVQQALEDIAGEDITLKYPAVGEYRSAIVMKDINNNGTKEAIAFYSNTTDSTVTMHINVIEKVEDEWKSCGDLSLIGSGVESVSFADLDGNGNLEIIVGWYIFGTTEKQVGIYTFEGGLLTQRAIEHYTNFTCADLTADGVDDLAVIYLNQTDKQATAKLLSLSDKGITEAGMIKLDPGVSSYNTPVLSKLTDDTPALYVDAVKGSGMITEMIWYKDGELKGLYNPETPEISPTYRNGTALSVDYNENGIIDIPMAEILQSTSEMAESDKMYYTNWTEFSGTEFESVASAFMNHADGYSISVPENLKQQFLIIRKNEARTHLFYEFNTDTNEAGQEIFRIVVVSVIDYHKESYAENGYTELGKTDSLVYLAKITEDNAYGFTVESIKDMFALLN